VLTLVKLRMLALECFPMVAKQTKVVRTVRQWRADGDNVAKSGRWGGGEAATVKVLVKISG
jgi:hypothetical protein